MERRPNKKGGRNPKTPKIEDFYKEYIEKDVEIHLSNGSSVRGRVVDNTRYFYKVVTGDSRVVYVNKAHVLYVELKDA